MAGRSGYHSGKGHRQQSIRGYTAGTSRLIANMQTNPSIAAAQAACEMAHVATVQGLITP